MNEVEITYPEGEGKENGEMKEEKIVDVEEEFDEKEQKLEEEPLENPFDGLKTAEIENENENELKKHF